MDKIELYFKKLKSVYNCDIKFCKNKSFDYDLSKIPKVIQDLYKIISIAELPFGRIFSIDEALKMSEVLPFKPNWFVFGQDKYFSFWVCLYIPDSDGLSFTSWDHEFESEIDEPVYKDIVSFLKDEEKGYNSFIEYDIYDNEE